jgi:hypothetical protein
MSSNLLAGIMIHGQKRVNDLGDYDNVNNPLFEFG